MTKTRTRARCTACDQVETRWVGRCPGCGEWGTLVTESAPAPAAVATARLGAHATALPPPTRPAVALHLVPRDDGGRVATGIAELDRVLGGGLVAGSVTLVHGEPGAGKSTLLLQAADALARGGRSVLYVSAEESPRQVSLRGERLGVVADGVLLAAETELPQVLALVAAHAPDVLILDSVQSIRDPEVGGGAGAVAQVRACAAALTELAKNRGMPTILVGHVTKDGALAGPRVLEHLVDTVCELGGERHHALRLLHATKHRFGAVGEVGCFEMTTSGLQGIEDAGGLFIGDAPDGTTGVVLTMAMEGRRPLACEVQALVSGTQAVNPRRVATGLDGARLSLLVAVLERRADVVLHDRDVYASTVGGVRLSEPALDLALCLAIASSRTDRPAARDLVALGEVGLAGELRLVSQTERRLIEAARLGMRRAVVPAAYRGPDAGLQLEPVADLAAALAVSLRQVAPP